MVRPILVFQTDFTYKEGAVCAMYGVVKTVDRSLEIIDGSHELPQFDIWSASYRLYQSMEFWPKGTIFVSVVDPGVGTGRRPCAAKTSDGYFIITPDNGTLTHVLKWHGIDEVRRIDESVNRLKRTEGVSVFHGRDLFGYCAAKLASGIISFGQTGPEYPVEEIVTMPIAEAVSEKNAVSGIFEINDPNFGNLWTNIPLKMFTDAGFAYGERIDVTICRDGSTVYQKHVLFGNTFGAAEKGDDIIYNNELMRIAMAVSQGNFCEKYGLGYGSGWTVRFEKVTPSPTAVLWQQQLP
ncbi:MAG: SAM-dependent chlorinase/fluorinase [Treponema sp.]|jgi:S-adenosylmethionine hydrolase|nr:SAM-dependent chlorinase/fluorinase [Treponema sp.]